MTGHPCALDAQPVTLPLMQVRLTLHRHSPLPVAVLYGLLWCGAARAQMPLDAASLPMTQAATVTSQPVDAAAPLGPPRPWWDEQVKQPLRVGSDPVNLDLDSAVMGVLMFSPQVRIAADMPVIRQTQIVDAASRFDPRAFFDSKFTDTSDPVGNLLTTGGADRFIDQTAITSAGVKKTFRTGGQFEAAQRIGYQDNNSNFFIPKDQATARVTLNYTQPLLNGGGKLYNTSTICIAELQTQAATANLQRELQTIILETHRTYWDLYLRRAALLQRMRLKQQAIDIQRELQGRADFDVMQSQLVRANAAVATRDAAVIRFGTEIANSETRLRALINDPQLNVGEKELVPLLTPYRDGVEPSLADALTTALQNRPELQAAFAEVKAAGVRANVSKNELLPELNFLLGTYVSGLQGSSNFDEAWANQYDTGRPTYWTGLQFEYPLGNRGPNARNTQRLVELRQTTNRLNQLMIQTRAETETAVREVLTTHREMLSKYHAVRADQLEVDYLTERWRLLAGDQQLAGVVLNDVLAAQERLASAEYDYVAAEAAYNVALVNLNVVTGVLLQTQRVGFTDTAIDGVPAINVHADPQSQPAAAETYTVPPAAPSAPVAPQPMPAAPPATGPYYLRQTPSMPPLPVAQPQVAPYGATPPAMAQRATAPKPTAVLLPPVGPILKLPEPTPDVEASPESTVTPLPAPPDQP